MKKITKISAAIIATLAFASVANAATPGIYAGIGLGGSILRTPDHNRDIDGSTSASHELGGLGGKLFAGYNINKNVGVEVNYATYANSTYKNSGPGFSEQYKFSLDALSVVAKGYLPIAESGFDAYALGGLAEVRSQQRVSATGFNTQTTKTSAIRPELGVGVSYDVAQHITTAVELSRIIGKGNVNTDNKAIPNADMLTLNVSYNFG